MDWKRFFDSLGMDGTRWQWRIYRWQQNLAGWLGARGGGSPERGKQYKFCSECGAMLEKDERECPRCGAKAPRWTGWKLRKMLGLVLPSWCPVSMLIIFVNAAAFLSVGFYFGVRAMFAPPTDVLVRLGALVPPFVLIKGEWWRVITYGYLHIGIMHIGFNMFALSQVGPVLEERIGASRFFVVYTLTLLGGSFADLWLRGSVYITIAGASGALFGLIGFGLSYAHFVGGTSGRMERGFFGRWALYGFIFGMLVGADNIAHLGGFLVGAVLGYAIEREQVRGKRVDLVWLIAAWLLGLATVAALGWMIASK